MLFDELIAFFWLIALFAFRVTKGKDLNLKKLIKRNTKVLLSICNDLKSIIFRKMKNIIFDCQIFKTNPSICLMSFKSCKSNLPVAYNIYVVVQFYPWFKFYSPLFQTHHHTLPYPKTKEIKFKPRIKLNHNSVNSPTLSRSLLDIATIISLFSYMVTKSPGYHSLFIFSLL